jgi:hypothetical protein
MEDSAIKRLRTELAAVLNAKSDQLRFAIQAELAKPIVLEAGRRLQFEVDDFFFGITLCVTEGIILPGDWLAESLPGDWFGRAEKEMGGWNELITEMLSPWFAECWKAAGGPALFSPAYLFFHWYPQNQYDLEGCRWLSPDDPF